MIQISFVAPLPTLSLMEDRGTSDRHLCAAFAAILAMAPANAVFPMTIMGLNLGRVLILSVLGGLAAASSVYWIFGRGVSRSERQITSFEEEIAQGPSLLKIINDSGAEPIQIAVNIIPMLLVSLVVVTVLQRMGIINILESVFAPGLSVLGIQAGFVLPALTKYLAGSTALVGIAHEMAGQGHLDPTVVSLGGAGFLLHPFDLPGLAILLSAGPRLAKASLPAMAGACVGIALRTVLGSLFTCARTYGWALED